MKIRLKIVDNNHVKTKIIESLYSKWKKGYHQTNYGKTVTDLGRSQSLLEIMENINLSKEIIEDQLIILCSEGYAKIYELDNDRNQKNHKYLILDKGKKASIDHFFKNKSALRNRYTLFQIFGIVIGFLGFLMAVINTAGQIKKNEDIEILKQELRTLKKEYHVTIKNAVNKG